MLYGSLVTLRPMRRDDLPRLNDFNNSVEVELAGGGDPPIPQTLERLEAQFSQNLGNGDRDGTSFAIEADGKFIGQCALFRPDPIARTYEMGIVIGDKDYWGRGYGREAIELLVEYGFVQHNLHKIYLTVNGPNERAQASYRKVGFVEEGRLRKHVWSGGQYIDLVYMGLLREDWAAKRKSD